MTSIANTTFVLSPERIKQGAIELIVALGIFLGAVSLGHCGSGCVPIQDIAPTVHEVDYTSELARCVERSATKADSRKCRDDVSRRWGLCEKTDGVERCP